MNTVEKMNAPEVAIDFGTARIKVAYYDEASGRTELAKLGRSPREIIPALFHVGKEDILVGDDAEDRAELDPPGLITGLKSEIHMPGKKGLGSTRCRLSRVEIASRMFSHVKDKLEKEVFCDRPVSSCRITVPVCFEEQKREKIREAAILGGFKHVVTVPEPEAAGRAWLRNAAHHVEADSAIICDVGGGTTDFALLKRKGVTFISDPLVAPSGEPMGGDNLDKRIAESVQQESENKFTKCALVMRLRGIRERLAAYKTTVRLKADNGEDEEVPMDLIHEHTEEFLNELVPHIERYLAKCDAAGVSKGTPVVLIGGGSRISGLEERVKKAATNRKVYRWEESDYAVVLGAVDIPEKKVEVAPKKTEKEIAYDTYNAKVEAYWDDGEISPGEFTMLLDLRRQLMISREEAEQLETMVCGKSAEDLLLPVSKPSSIPSGQTPPQKPLIPNKPIILQHAEKLPSGIGFDCPACRRALHRDMILVGRTAECEYCGQKIYIPKRFGSRLASVGSERIGKIVTTDSVLLLVACPECGQVLTRKERLRYKCTRCDKCKTEFRVGCADDSSVSDVEVSKESSPEQYSGFYVGTCENKTVDLEAELQLELRVSGTGKVAGDLGLLGDLCGGGSIRGSIHADTISFVTKAGAIFIEWDGKISGDTIYGTYEVSDSGVLAKLMGLKTQKGEWKAKRSKPSVPRNIPDASGDNKSLCTMDPYQIPQEELSDMTLVEHAVLGVWKRGYDMLGKCGRNKPNSS